MADNPKSTGLTPSEIISLGIQQGHSADVILASLEAAGWKVVPEQYIEMMESKIRQIDSASWCPPQVAE